MGARSNFILLHIQSYAFPDRKDRHGVDGKYNKWLNRLRERSLNLVRFEKPVGIYVRKRSLKKVLYQIDSKISLFRSLIVAIILVVQLANDNETRS